uniref:Uncharacterized protein n=1 Tax=Arundo donax TaxID=35708 RepID=A0A0A9B052_ARUDO
MLSRKISETFCPS